ncbi:death-associated protein kinase related isoform X1 [Leguminivora glycinivorella]|uniref:death-associated protein kinase related isoform X1 n=1 Tax=Leguminivora glycinivorella TaxID=1035111 RepID=UPI002010BFAE|nr:death-associated protein kinase related isoform X1 [Leguminivora glycinivorella]
MSVISGLSKADIKTASDGLLELSEEKLRSIMRTEPITDVYHVEQTPFARGKFASVRKIRHLVSGEEYAAKFIRKRRRAADSSREIQHEVAVLALCAGCTRVVRLHEVYETRSEVAIVLELCAGGELQRLLDEEERLSEGAARRALRHVLEGLAHLHARRIAHLDLKPQNLLLTGGGEELLICDFGISRAIQPGAHVREILGTRDYVAPEILSYEPLSLAADMWSVGVLAYVLVSGYSPFAGETKQETYLNIAQCQLSFPRDLFRGVSQRAMQFIRDTLVVDPKGRLTVEECLEHPWLKDDTDIPRAIVGLGFDTAASDSDETENGVNGNGVNGHNGVNGVNGHSNGTNGTHDEEKERAVSPCAEERLPPLKHAHARDPAPPFPDAPSTPKVRIVVSRKSLPSPPSVLALCKKFQPDYEKPAARACPCECGACCPPAPAPCLRLRLPPARAAQDRALIC